MIPAINETDLLQRKPAIDLDIETFRRAGHQLVDDIASFLKNIDQVPVTTAPKPSELRKKLFQKNLPEEGYNDVVALLENTSRLLFENSLFNGHPKFWGYITSSPAPVGMLGDLLAAALNSNCGAFILSPMANEIEKQTIQWQAELIGYPKDCGGIMVSGGNMANFIGFLAGRRAKANWDIRKEGLFPSANKMRVYASEETHTWIQKAADLFGFGLDAVGHIPVDQNNRMQIPVLKQMIEEDKAAGLSPFMVIGTAGSVGTGAVDPLKDIAAICKEHGLWFHVDGAYGAYAAALPENKELFSGIELADSVAMDPHKWLYAPIEAGCTLVRDPEKLSDAFCFHPVYYNFDGEDEPSTNFHEFGLQNSRGFRALKVWLCLQQAGRSGYIKMIREDIQLAKVLFEFAGRHPELEAFTNDLSITTFRYRPSDLEHNESNEAYLNKLNQGLLDVLQAGGEVFPSNAVVDGKYLLRVCIVNFRTTLKDIESLPEIVVREGRKLHNKLRSIIIENKIQDD